ncbi:hypothetical protein ACVRY7_00945 [Streptococcus ictaluri]|uniref:Uncharacterized protein n=1 Tax=Streptococcus ictaluri 707-05 TaxID=764299 RepID=G5K0D0_9STRE|nr:hypothetical protein [Streptococcus ictaluri]EHI70614.1 hypothetical protein STRIC_0050 [Streptococcus ictaluri 707-05]
MPNSSTQTTKADELDWSDFENEFLLAPEQEGYTSLMNYLKEVGVNDFDIDFYLHAIVGQDFNQLLETLKTKTADEVKSQVATELSKIFTEAGPVDMIRPIEEV